MDLEPKTQKLKKVLAIVEHNLYIVTTICILLTANEKGYSNYFVFAGGRVYSQVYKRIGRWMGEWVGFGKCFP